MKFEELEHAFLNVRMNREKGIYAPHKPLLLLLVLFNYLSVSWRHWPNTLYVSNILP